MKEVVEGVPLDAGGEQGVPGRQQIGVHRLQCVRDIGQQLERQFGIQEGIVYLHPRQGGILILLDEVVVGVLRVGERAQVEGVDGRQVQQIQVRRVPRQEFEIVLDDVVPDEIRGSVGEFAECGKGGA